MPRTPSIDSTLPQMDPVNHPLDVQELVDRCIGFLRESAPDLTACALVARSWVYPAQSHLFEEAVPWDYQEIKHLRQWKALLEILQTYPHLIRHIRRLHISGGLMNRQAFSDLSLLPFTHVDEITFIRFRLSNDSAAGMERLLSMPTLRRVDMHCDIMRFEAFRQIWLRCSPKIEAVVFYCWAGSPHTFDPPPNHCAAPIELKSLTIRHACQSLVQWLQHDTCLFAFSQLKALSLSVSPSNFHRSPRFAPVFPQIEALNLDIGYLTKSADLSLFPNLKILSVTSPHAPWSATIDIFSTLPASNGLRNIALCGLFVEARDQDSSSKLDLILSRLLIHPCAIVELQPFDNRLNPAPYFPELASRNILHITGYDYDWFRNQVAML
ncbi:hypothetical protein B0H11DRAFT_767380 [Mycena galericulata]|nr:hypothetical protein B0H11DRAFT_767380 [Mycena galericulata]